MITVYTQPGCQPCKMAIKMIRDAGVEPTVINIREDEEAFVYLVDVLEASGTPVIKSDTYDHGALMFGFTPDNKDRLKAFIDAEPTA
ncbi:glutaredoxin family protein [Nocardia sp. NPDC055002]